MSVSPVYDESKELLKPIIYSNFDFDVFNYTHTEVRQKQKRKIYDGNESNKKVTQIGFESI